MIVVHFFFLIFFSLLVILRITRKTTSITIEREFLSETEERTNITTMAGNDEQIHGVGDEEHNGIPNAEEQNETHEGEPVIDGNNADDAEEPETHQESEDGDDGDDGGDNDNDEEDDEDGNNDEGDAAEQMDKMMQFFSQATQQLNAWTDFLNSL